MRRASRRKWKWLVGIVTATATIAGGSWLFPPHEKWLMEVAKPIVALGAYCYAENRGALAYQMTTRTVSPTRAWLHRVLPAINADPILSEGIWISRADGQEMRELGHVPMLRGAAGRQEDQIYGPEWLPDGKQVSFIYKKMLYVVPAAIDKQPFP